MPVRGVGEEHVLVDLYDAARAWLGPARWLDAHTHIGSNDPDGGRADARELLEALDLAGHEGALVFPMQEPGGYRDANDAVLAACAASDGRLRALGRVDPKAPDAVAEAARCLEAGARGIKLHPRSDAFPIDHPMVDEIVALAAQRRAVVLFHAGRGIPNLGAGVVGLAHRHPEARLVLAHCGISDLGLISHEIAGTSILFDTSWWQPSDMLTLLASVPPGHVLYASDMPYGPPRYGATALLRCARELGLRPDVVRPIVGEQLARVLDGRDLLDLGPAPGMEALGPRELSLERALAYLTAAVEMVFRGADPSEPLALARLGCQAPDETVRHAAVLSDADERIRLAQEAWERGDGILAGLAALAGLIVVATPNSGFARV